MQKRRKIINIIFLSLSFLFILGGLFSILISFFNSKVPLNKVNYNSRFINTKQVLFISSYSANFESYPLVSEGIKAVFSENQISFDVYFMDLKKYDTDRQREIFYDYIKYHVQTRTYDAVILGDEGAVRFALDYKDELFKNIPMVFFGVSDLQMAEAVAENEYITGSTELYDVSKIIDFHIDHFPDTKIFVGYLDTNVSGYGDIKQFMDLKNYYPDYSFDVIDTALYSQSEIIEKLNSLTEDSCCIVLAGYKDKNGVTYTISDISNMVVTNTNIPVYSKIPGSIGYGSIGGYIFNFKEAGYIVAEQIKRVIVDNQNISDIPLVENIGGIWVFDYNVLTKYGISEKSLPKNCEIINKPENFWKEYKTILIPCIVIGIGFILMLVIVSRYALEVRKQKEEAAINAKYDYLTKLPNRYFITTYINQLLNEHCEFSIIMLDVDDFKNFNDYYSHACGDEILKVIGQRLKILMERKKFFCSRFGGDEFLLICPNEYLDEDSEDLFMLKQVLSGEILYDNKKLFMRNSIGVAYSNLSFSTVDELIAAADFAMYSAKKTGKNKVVFFNDTMKLKAQENKNITKVMEEVIVNGGFYMLYQPQINVSTGQIHGYEALLRLHNITIPPSVFIPIAEEGGLISKIGRIVTEMVIKQIAKWKEEGLELHQVAINFSVGQVGDLEYASFLKGLLEKYDVDPSLIEIEITESMFLSSSTFAMNLFEDFKSIGVKLALDDFGTGYSSLHYLSYIPVNTVKLDKSMIDTYLRNGTEQDNAFLKNIVRLVHSTGMKFTAEGVEEKWQVDKLKSYHVDYIQGYYYSKPITGDEVKNFCVKQ